jgi:parvulin-like peptidyl-prolyl isomerase
MANKVKKPPVQGEDSAKAELIRRFKANPGIFIGTVVILIIVIVAFVFVPAIVPSAVGGTDLTFGVYDKTPIIYRPGNYFALARDEYTRQMQGTYNESEALYVNYQIWYEAFQATVIHTAVLQEVKNAGYQPPEELVNREVAQQFQINGQFSAAAYRQLDNAQRMALWREVQESISTERYRQDQDELLKPAKEEDFVVNMASRQRRVEGTAYNLQDYPEAEVAAFVAQNPNLFKTVHLSRITITAGEREARQILASVKDGTSSFEDAARNQSQDSYAERGGDAGSQMAYELSSVVSDEAVRNSILSLKKGEISDIVSTGTSWIFFRVEDDPVNADMGDSAQAEKIRFYLLQFHRGRVEDYFTEKAEELRRRTNAAGNEAGAVFDSALAEAGMGKFTFGPLAINYGNQEFFPMLAGVEGFTDQILSNFAVTDSFWNAAFFTPLGTVSEPLVLGDQIVVFRPLEETGLDEAAIETLKLYFDYYVLNTTQDRGSFFIQSPKLKDQFWETYSRYFMN